MASELVSLPCESFTPCTACVSCTAASATSCPAFACPPLNYSVCACADVAVPSPDMCAQATDEIGQLLCGYDGVSACIGCDVLNQISCQDSPACTWTDDVASGVGFCSATLTVAGIPDVVDPTCSGSTSHVASAVLVRSVNYTAHGDMQAPDAAADMLVLYDNGTVTQPAYVAVVSESRDQYRRALVPVQMLAIDTPGLLQTGGTVARHVMRVVRVSVHVCVCLRLCACLCLCVWVCECSVSRCGHICITANSGYPWVCTCGVAAVATAQYGLPVVASEWSLLALAVPTGVTDASDIAAIDIDGRVVLPLNFWVEDDAEGVAQLWYVPDVWRRECCGVS